MKIFGKKKTSEAKKQERLSSPLGVRVISVRREGGIKHVKDH